MADSVQVLPRADTRREARDAAVRRTVRYCWDRSSFYRQRLQDAGAEPEDIGTVGDLERLPVLLTKDDERELQEASRRELGHPFGEHLCCRPDEVVAVSSTSGTTGDPTYYAFTAQDVSVTDELWARGLRQAGVGRGSVCLLGFGLSMYLAGYPLARAVERMGAQLLPVGAEAGADRLLLIASHARPDALLCTPSYATYLIEKEPDMMEGLGLRAVVCAGEPGAGLPEVRGRIEEGTGAGVYDLLGGAHGILNASDGSVPYDGMTVLGDDYSVSTQLVDPETREPVPIPDDGTAAQGERVKTTLMWQAQPQLRSSVGDVYEVRRVAAPDGSTATKARVLGRTDDLLIVKGVKLYPAAARDVVAEFVPRTTGELRIVLSSPPPRVEPPLRIKVERGTEASSEDTDALASDIAARMHERLTVRPQVEVVGPGELGRTAHKSKLIEVSR